MPKDPRDDDRDVRRPKTPPVDVRAQTAQPIIDAEFDADDLTPVEGDPATQTNRRATQAAGSSRAALVAVRQVQATQKILGEQVKAYAEADKADHKEMKADIAEIKADVRVVSGHVGDIREEVGHMSGKLEVLAQTLQLEQKNDAYAKRVKMSYSLRVKEGAWKTVFKIVGAGGGAVAAGIAGYYLAKYLHG